jgi:hypothetical protein
MRHDSAHAAAGDTPSLLFRRWTSTCIDSAGSHLGHRADARSCSSCLSRARN